MSSLRDTDRPRSEDLQSGTTILLFEQIEDQANINITLSLKMAMGRIFHSRRPMKAISGVLESS